MASGGQRKLHAPSPPLAAHKLLVPINTGILKMEVVTELKGFSHLATIDTDVICPSNY